MRSPVLLGALVVLAASPAALSWTYTHACEWYEQGGLPCPRSTWVQNTYRPNPAFALSNWADLIVTWSSSRDNMNTQPSRAPGITGYRTSSNWGASAISSDSFAFSINGVVYGDPVKIDGDSQLFPADGSFRYLARTYGGNEVPASLWITRTLLVPPRERFVVVRYTVQNRGAANASVGVLDYTSAEQCQGGSSASFDSSSGLFSIDRRSCGHVVLSGALSVPGGYTVQAGESSGEQSPLATYARSGRLSGSTSYSSQAPQVAFAANAVSVAPGATATFDFFRVVATDSGAAEQIYSGITKRTPDLWFKQAAVSTNAWLDKGVQPKTQDVYLRSYFQIAMLAMKHSQNPTLGTFVASFHPAYSFKVWGRDAVFSAMIMDAGGYHEEAELFLVWLARAQMRDGNQGLHTCYSWWDGAPVGFVEPQFDSSGAALMAFYMHTRMIPSGDVQQFVSKVWDRVRAIEQFLQAQSGFVQPDYSIWEESSDGRTGQGIEPSHFTFTQGIAYGGLQAAALLEEQRGDSWRAPQLRSRADQVAQELENRLWLEGPGHYGRSAIANTLAADPRVDGSTVAVVFTGLTKNATRAALHLKAVANTLTRAGAGIARYENDPFFYDGIYSPGGMEVGAASPPWGVVTMFTAWAEMTAYGDHALETVGKRLAWMVDHGALGMMPSGEAIDGVTGAPVMSACPDLYEHAGVFAWTLLMADGVAPGPNPLTW
eukprot:m51a1_g12358 putative carbohydrate-binding family 6 protein (715) ;mRNA; f:561507-564478